MTSNYSGVGLFIAWDFHIRPNHLGTGKRDIRVSVSMYVCVRPNNKFCE